MVTSVIRYVNIRNEHKFLEIHNDGYYHNSVRQYMYWPTFKIKNFTGNGTLNRWKKKNLAELLKDYRIC